jgi:uncharacterized membrane protein
MGKGRLEAFSDGVFAIIITIMVLELKVPHGETLKNLLPLWPVFLSYVVSFTNVGIYWNNHHHMFHAVERISGGVLWANLHLLFWISLMPFATAFMGENHFSAVPVATYGFDLLMCGVAYYIVLHSLLRNHDQDSLLAKAVGDDTKGVMSAIGYVIFVPVAFFYPLVSMTVYIIIALIWLVPDSRFERLFNVEEPAEKP